MARSPNTEISTSDLADQLDTLKADIAALTQSIATMSKEKVAETAQAARAKANAARDEVENMAHAANDHAKAFMKEQPNVALGLAAGFGFLIGFFMARR